MARRTAVARRYAEAVFELARRDGTEDAWRVALDAAAEALGHADVLRIVENPAIPLQERLAAVRAALGAEALASLVDDLLRGRRGLAGTVEVVREAVRKPVGDQLVNLVGMLVERRRVERLPDIAREFGRLLDEHRGVVTAVATSAAPLEAGDVEALRTRVESLTGTQVQLRTEVDPSLIGGVTVRIGDRLYDGSVRGRLERLRNQLLAGSRPAHGSGA
jgi:F-type H+-transporting ATPase subunit delta